MILLANLLNMYLNDVFPSKLKEALIISIIKKSESELLANLIIANIAKNY